MVVGAAVIDYDPATLQGVQVSYGQFVKAPVRLAVDRRPRILVADGTSGIVEIDPATGAQTLRIPLSELGGDSPTGICVAPDGRVFFAVAGPSPGVMSFGPGGGPLQVVSSGGLLTRPGGLALGHDGMLYVCEEATPVNDCGPSTLSNGSIVRVDPASGAQTFIATSCSFYYPFDIAAVGANELWTTQTGKVAGREGCVLATRISDGTTSDALPGTQWCRSKSIAAAPDGSVFWGDCKTIGPDCSQVFTGHWPSGATLWGITGPLAVVPDFATPAQRTTWGAVRIIYR